MKDTLILFWLKNSDTGNAGCTSGAHSMDVYPVDTFPLFSDNILVNQIL